MSPFIPKRLGGPWPGSRRDPALTALFGSYDDAPAAPGLVSQYRNLLHHFVHQQGVFRDEIRPAHTFWTGCGMIRRERVPRIRRVRPAALSPPGHRGHRAGLPPHPGRPPDRPGARRPGHPHEAVDPARDDPHRHLPPRRALDAPDQALRHDRDRPERQGRPEGVRGARPGWRCWPAPRRRRSLGAGRLPASAWPRSSP